MPIARTLRETTDYTLERERGKEGASTFRLGVVKDSAALARVWDMIRADQTGAACRELLMAGGLRGWDLRDEGGADVKFQGKGGAAKADLDQLYLPDLIELGLAAWKLNNLTAEESD